MTDPIKIVWFGDLVTPSGFGRIGNEVTTRLVRRGYKLYGISMMWDGAQTTEMSPHIWEGMPLHLLPYPVVPAPGPDWPKTFRLIMELKPDVVVCCQDFPYSQTMFQASGIDWSVTQFMIVTPIDGTPIHPAWLEMVKLADSTLVISEFGKEGMRLAGKAVELLPPGINPDEFHPAQPGEVEALRAQLGIDPKSFVLGMFAMNQGRKCVSKTVEVFREFAREKEDAILYLDMEPGSPAGWDIPSLCQSLDPEERVLKVGQNVLFKKDALAKGIHRLRDRYLLCDVNSVVSHREGFGLPLIEAQACGIVAMALDWCSGPEIVGEGRGCLIRRIDYLEPGTWGNARDAFPDMKDWLGQLNKLYSDPDYRRALAKAGMEHVRTRTWDKATDAFEAELRRIQANKKEREAYEPKSVQPAIPAPQLSDEGANRAESQHPHPGLQSVAEGLQVPGLHAGVDGPSPDGGAGAGRLQPGVQPDGPASPAGGAGRPQS